MDRGQEGNRDFPGRVLYEDAIKRHVCARCIDFGEDGICHSLDQEGCAVFRFLPELVNTVKQTDDLRIESYIKAVRNNICMKCRNQNSSMKCELRDTLDCGLARYLPLVLEAIEEVQARLMQRRR